MAENETEKAAGFYWCPSCKEEVTPTYTEHCETCGHPVDSVELVEGSPLAGALAKIARQKAIIDKLVEACKEMRATLQELANTEDTPYESCWSDFDFSGPVDAALAEAGK